MAESAKSSGRGGKREGAGRKSLGKAYYKVRLLPEEIAALKAIGGSAWLEAELQKVIAGEVVVTLDTSSLDVAQRKAFVEGWQDAGGPTTGPSEPRCRPWLEGLVISVRGVDPSDWGRQYCRDCRAAAREA